MQPRSPLARAVRMKSADSMANTLPRVMRAMGASANNPSVQASSTSWASTPPNVSPLLASKEPIVKKPVTAGGAAA